MAEASNSINFMAMLNPQFAAQQQKFALQQAMAQQMMEDGSKQEPTAQLANPGGQVIANSPWAALSHAVEKGVGAYSAQKAIGDQLAAYKDMGQSSSPQDPNGMNQTELLHDMMARGSGTAEYQNRMAGSRKAAEESAIPRITPQGTYTTVPVPSPNAPPVAAPAASSPIMPPKVNPGTIPPADQASTMRDMYSEDTPAKPVILQGASDEQAAVPAASDGKPFLPNIKNISNSDPSGTPKFKTDNTTTGVEQTKQDIKDAADGNKAFAGEAQSLSQQGAQLNNLIGVYKDMQSGTLTMQNPEFFNKLVGMGIITNPSEIKDVAGAQQATQNHILQIIGQIKDANANAGGGAATRTFGSEITNLLEKGESAKAQPEALWNVIGQAKGLVDHHLDMINGWQKSGGLGNRLAGGYTMRPDDYAQQFNLNHQITDYRNKALKDMGPFKGMTGNNGNSATPHPLDGTVITDSKGNTQILKNGTWTPQ